MERYGIERRVYTAGKDKSMLDPFRPEREEDVVRIKELQKQIHKNFKDHITARRGDKLPTDQDLFTGEIWVGEQAIEVGLVDAVGHVLPVLKDRYGDKVRLRVSSTKRSIFQRFGIGPSGNILSSIEDKALWGRFGL